MPTVYDARINEELAMYEWGQIPSRRLQWVEGPIFAGWGCCECAWLFNSPGWPGGKSLTEMKEKFRGQLSQEFDSHICSNHARPKDASLHSQHRETPIPEFPPNRKGKG
jgi:hypothetical protein